MDQLLQGQSTLDAATWSARGRVFAGAHGLIAWYVPEAPHARHSSLGQLLNEQAATAQLSSGLVFLDKFIGTLAARKENVGPEECQCQIDALHADLSSEIPEQHVKNV